MVDDGGTPDPLDELGDDPVKQEEGIMASLLLSNHFSLTSIPCTASFSCLCHLS